MKIVPQLDTYPRLVTFCQTAWGKVALLVVFGGLLRINALSSWIEVTVAAAGFSFLPRHRHMLLSIAALYWLLVHHDWIDWEFIQRVGSAGAHARGYTLHLLAGFMLGGIFLMFALFFGYVRRHPGTFAARRPVMALLSVFGACLLTAGAIPLEGTAKAFVWTFIALLAPYLWFFAYALQDAASKTPDGPLLQFGAFHPIYMAPSQSSTPIGKGRAYLRKTEALTPEALSVVQLKAVKLLLWIAILRVVQLLLRFMVHGDMAWRPIQFLVRFTGSKIATLALPDLGTAIEQLSAGSQIPTHDAWLIAIAHFTEAILGLYIAGNLVVACCRMGGFYILRNTYRPFQAQTIAEFWNRIYYYFKELLVEFFFFPTYMRYFKKYRRLRAFVATMAAATLGNMVYHFFRDFSYVADAGLSAAVSGFQVYAFYALLLGVGIGVSQMRSQRSGWRRATNPVRRVLSSIFVLAFYCLIEIFDQEGRSHTLGSHLAFFLSLFSFHT